ncbi:MAG TPA: hypothetical protein VK996_00510 [Ramlibacter sp.]|nr:hypothetical protein [Ramlibacter sp.]
MFSLGGLLAPLQAMAGWFAPSPAPVRSTRAAIRPAIVRTRPGIPAQCRRAARPLRVFRVADEHAAVPTARVVISGRMEDVCAELDRLASLETTRR